jgi:hydrogenase maturation factor
MDAHRLREKASRKNNESPWRGFRLARNRALAVRDVHRYFEAETHFGEFRLGPHNVLQK